MQEKKQENSPIKARILQYIESKGITKYAFYRDSKVSRGILDQATGISEENIAKFLAYAPDISLTWLFTGEGTMTDSTASIPATQGEGGAEGASLKSHIQPLLEEAPGFPPKRVFKLKTDQLLERQTIPIYDIEAVAGLVPLFTKDYLQHTVDFVEAGLIPKCDGGIRIVGDSMYPLLKSGDVVFYKQIHDIVNSIIWGEMYLISFDLDGEEYVCVKYIKRSELDQHILLVSYNQHHPPMEIHISRVRALAFVKASLRINTIK